MRRLFVLIVVALFSLTTAQAQDMTGYTKQQRSDTIRFAANNSLFVLYHEMGHLLIDQLGLPVLGREEDAADNISTWTLLNKRTEAAEKTLADATEGWLLTGAAYRSGKYEEDFAAAHSLDKQRAYQIVCLMVGSDETAFKPIANQYAIGRDRQESCYWDYELVNRSLKAVLENHTAEAGNSTVNVTYHDAGGRLKFAADAFRSSGVFDEVADEVRKKYQLRRPVRFNAKRCGEANAYYDPDTVEIIFCYELMKDFMELYQAELPQPASTTPAPMLSGVGKEKGGAY
ncbi:MAG TPA: DUF4344 domain-containing metallopeptidase [Devosia sp.]|nr:DUF4344 domain-containing metallopeptidase [Devosia sp.]